MRFDWQEYLKLAQELAGQSVKSNEEARLRSSISRAYYAAFCNARNYLHYIEGHKIPSTSYAHRLVREQFKKSNDRLRRDIGIDMERLRQNRNKADYHNFVSGLQDMTCMSLSLAENIISKLNMLLSDNSSKKSNFRD